ncbi:MAG TPA: 30S ribosomal protein S6 [Pyrinomonadaceae bacterium]|nr:30S ribosomal protein S6 [Pyrinomonadaceae bacterium]
METQRQYEVVFIVNPDADDDEVTRLSDGFKQIVTDQGGTVTKHESMGRRKLAYEILHKTEGNFVLLEIEGSGREIAELERRMRVNDRIIRYITVRVDEDRQRAEKFKAKRDKKAAKRSGGGLKDEQKRGGSNAEAAGDDAVEANLDAA